MNLKRTILSCLALLTLTSSVLALEPWADKGLPVTDGLEMWYDGSAQVGARVARFLAMPLHTGPVDYWFDGSGNHRHLSQLNPAQRPHFRVVGNAVCIRFDGANDFLSAENAGLGWTNMTVFVVANARSNGGFFRGFVSGGTIGRNDYNSGFNLDLGSGPTPGLSVVNSEGAGFNGMRNLLNGAFPFGAFHTFALAMAPGKDGVQLFVDGKDGGKRDRAAGSIKLDAFTVGARYYSNDSEPSYAQGFLDGDIAEVLVYSRVLEPEERRKVEAYLATREAVWSNADERNLTGIRPLQPVENPPAIQMLVPGFTVRPFPLELPNINNVKYRPDGKLFALGYNGHIWVLSDTDGDGIEDKAVPFWDKDTMRGPIGIALTPPGYAKGNGLFVAANGRIVLIVDKDGDDRADEELTVTTWDEKSEQGNVDALGVALDKEGNLYFGLGTKSFVNGHQVNKSTGESGYSLTSVRGTIQKVSPDWQHRETICTGVRFTVGMSFNRLGDLFVTDQEGATWLPNGNPFDELLHIQTGRHYGFPPRHPKYLPNVVDEPSVFDYAPQHQSTCGFNFNESVNGGPTFGPSWWAGDALVTGESRGKLFRTKLVKTAAGYVAQNQLIGCLGALTIDLCVSPRGDLVVSTHSGKPDWGTGPSGIGKLYQVSYTGKTTPEPALVWSASPTEIRVAFDRPLDPANLKNLTKETKITQGKFAQAGDRFESIRPGYQVVQDQMATPRYNVPVLSASVTPDNRTLLLTTPPRPSAVNYAIELPAAIAGETDQRPAKGAIASRPQIDLVTSLNGVQATWQSKDGKEKWSGWLPHVDLAVAREFTRGSAEHERLWELIKKPGILKLETRLDLSRMAQPAIQPGSKLDYEYPPENVELWFQGPPGLRVRCDSPAIMAAASTPTTQSFTGRPPTDWPRFTMETPTPYDQSMIAASWRLQEQPDITRAFALRRFYLPGAEPSTEPVKLAEDRKIPELAGGNWLNGRRLFFGEQAMCSKCHTAQGQGGRLGPDLSNLIHRDYASVMKDIREPSAAINPDHVAFNVELTDGESFTGVMMSETPAALTLGDTSGKPVVIPKTKVKSIKPSALSLMPEGLDKALGEARLKDLLTFLMVPSPIEAAPLAREGAPPARSRAEVESFLAGVKTNAANPKSFYIVLCDGPKDHGIGEHDYGLWKQRWSRLLALADSVKVETAARWPSAEQLAKADVIAFFNNNPDWNAEHAKELDAFLARGGGAAYFHWALEARDDAAGFATRIGLASNTKTLKFRHGPVAFDFQNHPLAQGFSATHFTREKFIDETYWNFVGDPKDVQLVATAVEDGQPQPEVWTRNVGKGRVFVSVPGHYNWTFDDPLYRALALRGICWAAGQPMDRLVELITVGARMAD